MKRQIKLRKKLLAALITSGVASTLALPTMVWAQTANANLRGTAPPNAQVTARNIATGAVRVTKASASGSYVLVGLPPGTYRVDAGPGTAQTVTLSVAATSTLDLSRQAAAAPSGNAPPEKLQAVQVVGTALLDTKNSEVGQTVSLHQIETLPQVSRNFLEFADTVPGMVFSVDSQGHTFLKGGAQNYDATNIYIDGVGQKNDIYGGPTGQFFSQGNPFPQLAIGQYKVITSNYKAEYAQVSSAAVTAVTKYGTNQFHGEVFGDYTGTDYRDMTPAEKASGTKTQSVEKEYGFALGGPIIPDKMHFFITNSVKRFDTPTTVVPGVADTTDLLPADAQAQLGTADNPFFENLFFGDIDWEITDRDRLEFRAQIRNENAESNIGGVTAASNGLQTKNTDKRYVLDWQHSADAWFNELQFTYENAFYTPEPITDGIGQVYTYGPNNNATILQTGAPSPLATQNKGQKGPGFKDDLTFNDFHWLGGDHTVKMGVEYKEITLTAQNAGFNTAQAFYNVCPADSTSPNCPPGTPSGTASTPYKIQFPSPTVGYSPVATSKDKQFGAYVQDDWAINDHLTLNLGVRWDIDSNPSYLNWVTPANIVAALNGPNTNPDAPAGQTYAQALALGGININDYISNGHNRSAYKGEWQPRLGFSYDINGDAKHVIFGGAGRSYDRNLYQYLQLEQTNVALSNPTYYFSTATQACTGQPCVPWDPSYLNIANLQALVQTTNAGKEVDMINNDLKVPYSDQFSIGMRNTVGEWNTSAAIARVNSYNGFIFTLGNRYPSGAFWMNTSQPWGDPVPGFGNLILGNNGVETRSTQVLLSLEKPYTRESGWGVTVAYTYTNADQNRDILNYGGYGFDEATIQDYPFITSDIAPKHRLVATGVIDGPWGITLSTKLTLATPTPVNAVACYGATYANGSTCLPVAAVPGGGKRFLIGGPIFGYRDIDFAAIKNIRIAGDTVWYLRLDILNAFNYKNYVDTIQNWGSNGVYDPDVVYNTTGQITGIPRTLKFTMGVRW
ncbi:MAG: TonB-dependent receptor [Rhodanobacteraceae bacterium]